MLFPEVEFSQRVCSQRDEGAQQAVTALGLDEQTTQQGMNTPQQSRGGSSGKKRTFGVCLDLPLSAEQAQPTRRELFRDQRQGDTSITPLPAPPPETSAAEPLHATVQSASIQTQAEDSHHKTEINIIQQVSCPPPRHITWSQLQGCSSEVLHARLERCNLLPQHTQAGQQLLELEMQSQSKIGLRVPEYGDDEGNICWVDNGLLLYPEGVKSFAITYGDAECAQVPFVLLCWLETRTIHIPSCSVVGMPGRLSESSGVLS